MMILAYRVLQHLGATEVVNITENNDPTTESEFLALQFTSATPITWEMYQSAYSIVEQTVGVKLLRIERSRLLAKTDWIMTVDNAETLANKSDWVAYRQALRDLPENPPTFVWNGPQLNFSQMDMPVEPPVIRITAPAPAPEPEPTPA